MRQLRINFLKAKIRNEAEKRYSQKIDISGDFSFVPLLNNGCHYNAVHAIKSGKAEFAIECVIVDSGEITAHYINQKSCGSYIDITLGWAYSGSDYRFSRIIGENEGRDPSKMLSDFKSRLCDKHISLFDKYVLRIDKWDLS